MGPQVGSGRIQAAPVAQIVRPGPSFVPAPPGAMPQGVRPVFMPSQGSYVPPPPFAGYAPTSRSYIPPGAYQTMPQTAPQGIQSLQAPALARTMPHVVVPGASYVPPPPQQIVVRNGSFVPPPPTPVRVVVPGGSFVQPPPHAMQQPFPGATGPAPVATGSAAAPVSYLPPPAALAASGRPSYQPPVQLQTPQRYPQAQAQTASLSPPTSMSQPPTVPAVQALPPPVAQTVVAASGSTAGPPGVPTVVQSAAGGPPQQLAGGQVTETRVYSPVPAAPGVVPKTWQIGDRVRMKGISEGTQYYGKCFVVLALEGGQCRIKLEDSETMVIMPSTFLEPFDAPAAADPSETNGKVVGPSPSWLTEDAAATGQSQRAATDAGGRALQPGDLVRLVGKSLYEGKVYTVESADCGDGRVRVSCQLEGNAVSRMAFDPAILELVSAASPTSAGAAPVSPVAAAAAAAAAPTEGQVEAVRAVATAPAEQHADAAGIGAGGLAPEQPGVGPAVAAPVY
eukprot:SRR837773.5000.p1 GENE.SRR837773.5000~~SRR837773.5000.p1  ORF type:complete len:596 (-),score=40.88 SRR837773.5000:119-1645(-)